MILDFEVVCPIQHKTGRYTNKHRTTVGNQIVDTNKLKQQSVHAEIEETGKASKKSI